MTDPIEHVEGQMSLFDVPEPARRGLFQHLQEPVAWSPIKLQGAEVGIQYVVSKYRSDES